MNEALGWLLDIDAVSLGAENLRLGFERSIPMWAWPGILVACLALAGWSYWRLSGPLPMRAALASLRGLLLALLAVLVAGPQLVQRDVSIEQDWVLVLADRSASLTVEDAPGRSGGREARDRQLRRALQDSWPMWRELEQERTVVWLGFDGGAYPLEVEQGRVGRASRPSEAGERSSSHGGDGRPAEDGVDGRDGRSTGEETQGDRALDLGEPDGRRTNLGAALDQALRRAAARPLAGVVVLSDGRSLDEPSRSMIRRLQAERIPVFTTPLGSEQTIGDVAVARVEGPGAAFVDDIAPVKVDLEHLGVGAEIGGELRLIDQSTGMVLDEQEIEPGDEDQRITLTHRPEEAGDRTWVVEFIPDGVDLIEGNNSERLAVELIDRPLRVLYVDGYPRWEQRYLKNLLVREGTVVSSNLLLAPARRYTQEGDVELGSLPTSPEEWSDFDVVILGDVRPEVFNEEQLANLLEHVAARGAGLLWVAGPSAVPQAWRETPLADLIPFTAARGTVGAFGEAVLMAPTPRAEALGVLRLGSGGSLSWPSALSDPSVGWSRLRWAQRIDPAALKPTAEALATARVIKPGGVEAEPSDHPLVISMRYGAGRSLYVATDEVWRWRYGRGERLPEQFWIQLVRLLGRESVARSGKAAVFTAQPRRALIEQPVRVAIELLDQSLVDQGLGSVTVRAQREDGVEDDDDQRSGSLELTLTREADDSRVFSTTWLPDEPGRWRLTPTTSALSGRDLEASVNVSLPDDELRRPQTDHPLLVRLSEQTNGAVLEPENLSRLPEELPNRRVRRISETAEPLWDTPLALMLVIGLLTVEWLGRRIIRLI